MNPAFVHLNEDGSNDFDMCRNNEYDKREFAVGEFLDDKFVICGGMVKQNCEAIDETGVHAFDLSTMGRAFATNVKLNQSTMWITGGVDSNWNFLTTTTLVTTTASIEDVSLPFSAIGHCMVEIAPEKVMLIGGMQDGTPNSDKSWIIDINIRSETIPGPSLKEGRQGHSCGTIKDDFGHAIVIVTGGESKDTTEFLNTTSMSEWIYGNYSVAW